jgi:hypothetical protein
MVAYEAALPWRKWVAKAWEDFGAAPLGVFTAPGSCPAVLSQVATAESGLKAR